ncbi:hypothetical protein HYFRA_00003272 [Hymenoscyphus fraxineus]|uniref:Uncharacterized protein n=1 Tax=Hymenoscyphus fraxineus TaxID=746836 RepID=A0A9N9PT31_9HELO|nr:hypothetical protein HYFRA_00003272 [Hymenoscyphus fraxineus]
MFRYTRPRLGLFSTTRLPLRLEAQKQQGKVLNLQRVEMRRKGISAKAVILGVFTTYVCFQVFDRLVFGLLEDKIEGLPEPEEEDNKALFIPFPGTAKEVKPPPYRGTDPEWQEFIKFSKDRPLQDRVRDELAQYVRRLAEQHPFFQASRIGRNLKLRRCWLDVDFPQHPPPEFVRSGIEISDDAISWITTPVDSTIVFRNNRLMRPTAVAKSIWEFTKVVYKVESQRIAGMLGIQSQSPPLSSIDQMLARQQQMLNGSGKDPQGSSQVPGATVDGKSSVIKVDAPVMAGSEQKDPNEAEVDIMQKAMLANQQRFLAPLKAFKQKLRQTWRRIPDYPPRGSILMTGMVELESTAAYFVFDVRAAWNPKERAYDQRSMFLTLRRFQMKKQGPTGK